MNNKKSTCQYGWAGSPDEKVQPHMVLDIELKYLNIGPEKAKKGSEQGARCPCSLAGWWSQEVWLLSHCLPAWAAGLCSGDTGPLRLGLWGQRTLEKVPLQWVVSHYSLIKKMPLFIFLELPTCQSDGDNPSTDNLSSQMTLACMELTID